MSDDATSLQDIMMILMILMMTSRTEQLRQPTLSPSKLPTQARNVASISSSLSPRWREWGTKGVWSPERERQREQVVRARQRQSTNE